MKARARTVLGGVTTVALVSAVWAPDHAGAKVDPDPSTEVTVVGAMEFSDSGQITVNSYRIAPAGAFRPSSFDQGDVVVVIGNVLPDGKTIRAQSCELFEDAP